MDFLARVKDYLAANIELNAPITTPILSVDSSSIAIRQTPSSINSRYVEGKITNFSFQVLVKDTSHVKAYNTIQAVFKALDGLPKGSITSYDGSFSFIKCECTTLPNFVEKTDKNEYIYTAIFQSELEV
ncbi:minor capsid protein [Anoxybacillus sp. UARK-01]|uniref:minor capsid protein n=1 Tax=Anoxybacillus sp. UARK-01 TaxID=1895648 RepID=UPI0013747655|nr:minor capsid protein [Anoxybacillus sp. UARK-01]